MILEVNSIPYENFTSASAEIRLDALSNTFSFDAVSADQIILPFNIGDPCRILVDDSPVITGFIEVISGSMDAGSHSISIQGRDKTGDLLDSSIGALDNLKETITLKALIEKVISHVGLNLNVIDEANPKAFNPSEDSFAPEAGDNAFEFLEAKARKRQVLLTSNGDGDIVISRSPGGDSGAYLQNIVGATDNNILASSWSYDQTGRFNVYKFASGLNTSLFGKAKKAISSVVNQSALIEDAEIRAGRQFVLVAEAANSNDQNNDRATWEANIRKARGRVYSCTVQGYKADPESNFLWNVNELAQIVDNFAQIDSVMLINSVAFSFSLSRGKSTTLSFVEKKAYSLELAEPTTDKVGTGNPFK